MGSYRLPVRGTLRTFAERTINDGRFRLMRPYGDTSACFLYNGQRICPLHTGEDYGNFRSGADVVAQHDGVVEYVGHLGDKSAEYPRGMGGYGVIINFGGGYQQLACHMIEGSCPFKPGDWVSGGTTVGQVGQTGAADGAHLHNELIKNGRTIDPAPHQRAGSLPIAAQTGDDVLEVTDYSHIYNRKSSLTDGSHFRSVPSREDGTSLQIFPAGTVVVVTGQCKGEDVGGNPYWYVASMWVAGRGKTAVGVFHTSVFGSLIPVEVASSPSAGQLESARSAGFVAGRDKAAAAAAAVTP